MLSLGTSARLIQRILYLSPLQIGHEPIKTGSPLKLVPSQVPSVIFMPQFFFYASILFLCLNPLRVHQLAYFPCNMRPMQYTRRGLSPLHAPPQQERMNLSCPAACPQVCADLNGQDKPNIAGNMLLRRVPVREIVGRNNSAVEW